MEIGCCFAIADSLIFFNLASFDIANPNCITISSVGITAGGPSALGSPKNLGNFDYYSHQHHN